MQQVAKFLRRFDWVYIRTIAGVIAAVLFLLTMFFQLAFPYDRFLPGQKIDGMSVGMMTHDEARTKLTDAYQKQDIDFISRGRLVNSVKVSDLGISLNLDKEIDDAKYSLRQRMIPGSWIMRIFSGKTTPPALTLNTPQILDYLNDNYNTLCTVAPTNATIVVEDGRLRLIDDIPGLICDENLMLSAILEKPLELRTPLMVEMRGRDIDATITAEMLKPDFEKYRSQLIKGVTIAYGDKQKMQIRYADIVHWLNIDVDETGWPEISYSDDKIKEFLMNDLAKKVLIRPGITVVNMLNEVEVNRKIGNTGEELDFEKEIAEIKTQLKDDTKTDDLIVALVRHEPRVEFQKQYSKNAAGMATLFMANFGGEGLSASIIDLSGHDMSYSAKEHQQWESDRATQIITAYLMNEEVIKKKISWNDQINNQKLSDCFMNIINNNDENCRKDFMDKIKKNELMMTLNERGFIDTRIENEKFITSSVDLARLLAGVVNNTIMSEPYRGKLRDIITNDKIVTLADGNLRAANFVNNKYVIVAFSNDEHKEQALTALGYVQEIME